MHTNANGQIASYNERVGISEGNNVVRFQFPENIGKGFVCIELCGS